MSCDLVQIPSAAYLIVGHEPRSLSGFPRQVLALADPVFSLSDPRVHVTSAAKKPLPSLPRLPFTDELDAIRHLVPETRRRILTGFDATDSALESSDLRDFAFVHLSTHAIIDDRIPDLSRIAVSGFSPDGVPMRGFIGPETLTRWKLGGSTVVLAACGTALGKPVPGEGVLGLTTSIFQAGAAQIVASISNVDAEATSILLKLFYEGVLGPRRLSPERALALARRELSLSARWKDPYFWATFAVFGRPITTPISSH